MLWLGASNFGDDGRYFRKQERRTLPELWRLGIERTRVPSFAGTYLKWSEDYDLVST